MPRTIRQQCGAADGSRRIPPALKMAPASVGGYMNLKWIAQRLHMGSWTYVSNLLNEQPPTQPQSQKLLPLCQ